MTASAADLAATVRDAIANEELDGCLHRWEIEALAALDALLARCEEAERRLAFFTDGGQTITVGKKWLADSEAERDEALEAKRGWCRLYSQDITAARARVVELEQALRALTGSVPTALQSGGSDNDRMDTWLDVG